MTRLPAFRIAPQYRDYVWGGSRLRPQVVPTAEAWVVYEHDLITTGKLAGRTLGEAASQYGAALLGKKAYRHTGVRFPLLIKLLDCVAWLSLQVHPDDDLARRMAGPDQFGKTEAWHFIEAAEGAEILCGVQPGITADRLAEAIRGGTLLELMQRIHVQPGDSIFIPARMIHALGPGLLVYEVQQTSDLTYRVFDWDRPATPARPLHIDQSIAAADPALSGSLIPNRQLADGEVQVLVSCPYFILRRAFAHQAALQLDTRRESFHAVTVISGAALIEGAGWQQELSRFETLLMPAACDAYQVVPQGEMQALISSAA